jgi:hypothetical protein
VRLFWNDGPDGKPENGNPGRAKNRSPFRASFQKSRTLWLLQYFNFIEISGRLVICYVIMIIFCLSCSYISYIISESNNINNYIRYSSSMYACAICLCFSVGLKRRLPVALGVILVLGIGQAMISIFDIIVSVSKH